jgi:hypothetical protein
LHKIITIMKINPKTGIDKLIFGMAQNDVEALYGKPNKSFKDEDDNNVYQYNSQKLRLTFYKDENFKLGYIVGSSQDLVLFDKKVIGRAVADVQKELNTKDFAKWEKEEFDTLENYFNETNWMILQTEFDDVVKVEVGAIINNKDEFDWKFKK